MPKFKTLVAATIDQAATRSGWAKFRNTFRQSDLRRVVGSQKEEPFNTEYAARQSATSALQRRLRGRHLQMIILGASFGGGLFIDSGNILSTSGPASLVLGYITVGSIVFFTVHALCEMSTEYPIAGAFYSFSVRFLEPAWGMTLGWSYLLLWLLTIPFEVVSTRMTLEYWNRGEKNLDGVLLVILAIYVVINISGVRVYGETEFILSLVKILTLVGFLILAAIISVSGDLPYRGPYQAFVGKNPWISPGPFHNGFKGYCSTFVSASFAFGGTELVSLASAETIKPQKTTPRTFRTIFWRFAFFYVSCLTLIGVIVPYNDPRLRTKQYMDDVSASPFIIVIRNAGIDVLPGILSAVIMLSLFSVGNTAIYTSSRMMASLAEHGHAPRFLAFIDRNGRPLVSLAISVAFGLLGYMLVSTRASQAFDWLVAIIGSSTQYFWATVFATHIRFRKAWLAQGHSVEDLAYTSPFGATGSCVGLVLLCLLIGGQTWVSIWPIDYERMTVSARVIGFFMKGNLTWVIFMPLFAIYKLIKKTKMVPLAEIDFESGRNVAPISRSQF